MWPPTILMCVTSLCRELRNILIDFRMKKRKMVNGKMLDVPVGVFPEPVCGVIVSQTQ